VLFLLLNNNNVQSTLQHLATLVGLGGCGCGGQASLLHSGSGSVEWSMGAAYSHPRA